VSEVPATGQSDRAPKACHECGSPAFVGRATLAGKGGLGMQWFCVDHMPVSAASIGLLWRRWRDWGAREFRRWQGCGVCVSGLSPG
jgi:hypothetical protein